LAKRAHLALSNKKNEMIVNDLKKLTAKDKNAVIKILEDVKMNDWKIRKETMNKLTLLSQSVK